MNWHWSAAPQLTKADRRRRRWKKHLHLFSHRRSLIGDDDADDNIAGRPPTWPKRACPHHRTSPSSCGKQSQQHTQTGECLPVSLSVEREKAHGLTVTVSENIPIASFAWESGDTWPRQGVEMKDSFCCGWISKPVLLYFGLCPLISCRQRPSSWVVKQFTVWILVIQEASTCTERKTELLYVRESSVLNCENFHVISAKRREIPVVGWRRQCCIVRWCVSRISLRTDLLKNR